MIIFLILALIPWGWILTPLGTTIQIIGTILQLVSITIYIKYSKVK